MKRILIVTITVFFAIMVTNVQAADVSIDPGSVELTIESGNSAAADLLVKADSKKPYMILSFMPSCSISLLIVGLRLNPKLRAEIDWESHKDQFLDTLGSSLIAQIPLTMSSRKRPSFSKTSPSTRLARSVRLVFRSP